MLVESKTPTVLARGCQIVLIKADRVKSEESIVDTQSLFSGLLKTAGDPQTPTVWRVIWQGHQSVWLHRGYQPQRGERNPSRHQYRHSRASMADGVAVRNMGHCRVLP